jgi:hypothetical protein
VILVACPTARVKDYALSRWLECFYAFNTSDRAMFMADNTPGTLSYLYDLRAQGVPCVHVEPMPDFWDSMHVQWQAIVARAHEIGAEWIASIEADMVCPPETLNVLLAHSGGYRCIAHDYPARDAEQGRTVSLGCTLLETRWLWESRYSWPSTFENFAHSSGANRDLTGLLDIVHLDG